MRFPSQGALVVINRLALGGDNLGLFPVAVQYMPVVHQPLGGGGWLATSRGVALAMDEKTDHCTEDPLDHQIRLLVLDPNHEPVEVTPEDFDLDVISSSNPKARVGHTCGACGKAIHSGTTYHSRRIRLDGEQLLTLKCHMECRPPLLILRRAW